MKHKAIKAGMAFIALLMAVEARSQGIQLPEIGDCDAIVALARSHRLSTHRFVSEHSGASILQIEDRAPWTNGIPRIPYTVYAETPQGCYHTQGNIAYCDQLLAPLLKDLSSDDAFALKLAWSIWQLYGPETHGGPIAPSTYRNIFPKDGLYPAPQIASGPITWELVFLALRQDGGVNRWTVLINHQRTITGIQIEEFEGANVDRILLGCGSNMSLHRIVYLARCSTMSRDTKR